MVTDTDQGMASLLENHQVRLLLQTLVANVFLGSTSAVQANSKAIH